MGTYMYIYKYIYYFNFYFAADYYILIYIYKTYNNNILYHYNY